MFGAQNTAKKVAAGDFQEAGLKLEELALGWSSLGSWVVASVRVLELA